MISEGPSSAKRAKFNLARRHQKLFWNERLEVFSREKCWHVDVSIVVLMRHQETHQKPMEANRLKQGNA